MSLLEAVVERGVLPDPVLRAGIRRLLRRRLAQERAGDPAAEAAGQERLAALMKESPIAVATADANAQHYEVPAGFFRLVLGRAMKYSSALWEKGVDDLDAAEQAMLELTCERAGIGDGCDVLDLGCGWGSLTLYAARRFPSARVTGVSNSKDQRLHIESEARRLDLANVTVLTADMNTFEPEKTYDRVVSIEMFEHMRNWEKLLARIATWMRPDSRLFLHAFAHRSVAYFFEDADSSDWMARRFFTGGLMPSVSLLRAFEHDVRIEEQWQVSGLHYAKTSEAWLSNLDTRRCDVLSLFCAAYGRARASRHFHAWRVFFLACAELFGYRGGTEWLVHHALLRRV